MKDSDERDSNNRIKDNIMSIKILYVHWDFSSLISDKTPFTEPYYFGGVETLLLSLLKEENITILTNSTSNVCCSNVIHYDLESRYNWDIKHPNEDPKDYYKAFKSAINKLPLDILKGYDVIIYHFPLNFELIQSIDDHISLAYNSDTDTPPRRYIWAQVLDYKDYLVKKYKGLVSFLKSHEDFKLIMCSQEALEYVNEEYKISLEKLSVVEPTYLEYKLSLTDLPFYDNRITTLTRISSDRFNIDILKKINSSLKESNIILDIYGPIYDDYRTLFLNSIETLSNIEYKGIIHPTKVSRTLKSYKAVVSLDPYYNDNRFIYSENVDTSNMKRYMEPFGLMLYEAAINGLTIFKYKQVDRDGSSIFTKEGLNCFSAKTLDELLGLIKDNFDSIDKSKNLNYLLPLHLDYQRLISRLNTL